MTTNAVLTGQALIEWLKAQLNFFYNNPEGLESQDLINILKGALESTECLPDTPESLFDYHRLYIAINESEAAIKMLEQFENSIFNSLDNLEQSYFSIMVSYWKTNLFATVDKNKFISQSAILIDKMFAYPNREDIDFIWEKLIDGCAFLGLWDIYRKYYRLKIEFNPIFAENSSHYNEGQLTILIQDCRSFSNEGRKDEALNSARKVIDLLKESTNKSEISEQIWIDNANAIVHFVPEVIDEMISHINQFLHDDWHIAKKRDLNIKVSQIEARKKYAENKLDEAITIGLESNYQLSIDRNYYFTLSLIDWLIEANQMIKAARIAMNAVLWDLNRVNNYAVELAFKYKSVHPLVEWYVILCFYYDELIQNASNEQASVYPISKTQLEMYQVGFQEAYEAAKNLDAQHPSLQVLDLYLLRQRKSQIGEKEYHQEIIQKCETYFSNPSNFRSKSNICAYYRSKAYIEGIESVLSGEIIMASDATENFLVATDLFLSDDEWAHYVDNRREIACLQVKFQQFAKKQFETFFESGVGHFRDANIHNYSMLLRNICVELCENYYRTPEELIESSKLAIELSHMAISISSFAEHYYGVFVAYENLKDENAMIDSAEKLWQYSVKYGFSRFMPQKIANKIVRFLHTQGRYKEIQIWMQRLEQWYSYLDEAQKKEQQESYFFNRIYLLSHIVSIQPEESALWLEKEINSNPPYWENDETTALNIACIYRDLNQMDKAIEFYQLAIEIAKKYDYQPVIEVAERNLETIRINQQANKQISQKPWWKFW
ncbi:tetratricopeptide repeat protein [Thorsellia kenyensis]|uniref:Tetratricopeptide repeat protein n=1 Tax=Thorsellia kenyensis TaxID=1549888 RepID=A0ABV6CDZ0_9GAMM